MTRDDINSLSYSKWNCKYHVAFAPKYRRMIIYSQIKTDIGKILRKLCEQKRIEITEAEACPDKTMPQTHKALLYICSVSLAFNTYI